MPQIWWAMTSEVSLIYYKWTHTSAQTYRGAVEVFTNKSILSDWPFENNQRLAKFSIQTLQCDAHYSTHFWGDMHTKEADSAVWYSTHSRVGLYNVMPTKSIRDVASSLLTQSIWEMWLVICWTKVSEMCPAICQGWAPHSFTFWTHRSFAFF